MKIAIAGFGIEGEANYNYWSKDPNSEIVIVDEKSVPDRPLPASVKTLLGEGAFSELGDFDLVIRTASLSPKKIKTSGKIWSSTNEFLEKCPAKIIGVTATKGKGTISSLITSVLEAAGKKVWLVGNIGKAPLEVLDQIQPSDMVVFEMSSFQLWDVERSPSVAVIGTIEPDHLNIHENMDEYTAAKANIRKFQKDGDVCVYHPNNQFSAKLAGSSDRGLKIRYGVNDDGGVFVENGVFRNREKEICGLDALQLIGEHNVENACAAITVTNVLGVENRAIEQGLRNFKGLPHRLEFVGEIKGVKYYDDSISTSPGSTIAALRSFPHQHKILILGGSSKGSDFSDLASELTKHDVNTILIGDESNKLAKALDLAGFADYEKLEGDISMEQVITRASEIAQAGSVVLLSPAAASFGLFKDYADRGDQFKAAVNAL